MGVKGRCNRGELSGAPERIRSSDRLQDVFSLWPIPASMISQIDATLTTYLAAGYIFACRNEGEIMSPYLTVIKKYAVFRGRARRSEYWLWVLINTIVTYALTVVDMFMGAGKVGRFGLLSSLYYLALLMPTLAVAVRRFHDTGRSGWWALLMLWSVPISVRHRSDPFWLISVGLALAALIVFIVFMTANSQPGPNKYGPNPKEPVAIAVP
jgi:uncharacterized membrane protein YhaH (DUF805 family)